MTPYIYLVLAALLLSFAYIVFRIIVRRDYREHGHLRAPASISELLVFLAYFCFPYVFNPPSWPWFWRLNASATRTMQLIGIAIILMGFIAAFGTMAWFGNWKSIRYRS